MRLRIGLCVAAIAMLAGGATILSRVTVVHAAPACQTHVINFQYQSVFEWYGGKSNGAPSISATTSPGVGCVSIVDVVAPGWIKAKVWNFPTTASLDYHVQPLTDPFQSRTGTISFRTVIGGSVSPRIDLVINQSACPFPPGSIGTLKPASTIESKNAGASRFIVIQGSCATTGSSPVSWAKVQFKPIGKLPAVVIIVEDNPSLSSREAVLEIAGAPFHLHQEGWSFTNILNLFYGKVRAPIKQRIERDTKFFYEKKPTAVVGVRG